MTFLPVEKRPYPADTAINNVKVLNDNESEGWKYTLEFFQDNPADGSPWYFIKIHDEDGHFVAYFTL